LSKLGLKQKEPRFLYVFSVGSAGDSPAPLGDSPSGTEKACRIGKLVFFCCVTPIPPGESPGGTGKLPVPPTLNTYRFLNAALTVMKCSRMRRALARRV